MMGCKDTLESQKALNVKKYFNNFALSNFKVDTHSFFDSKNPSLSFVMEIYTVVSFFNEAIYFKFQIKERSSYH